jgi:hypothetical protein
VECSPRLGQASKVKKQRKTIWHFAFISTSVGFLHSFIGITYVYSLAISAQDTIVRKSKSGGAESQRVDIFRGVRFEDWLRMFMQVRVFYSYFWSTFCSFFLDNDSMPFCRQKTTVTTLRTKFFDISFCLTHTRHVHSRTPSDLP